MTESAENVPSGLDIGTDYTQVTAAAPRVPRPKRSLPRWAVVALAVLVGWMLGTLIAAQRQSDDAAVVEPLATNLPSAAPVVPTSERAPSPTAAESSAEAAKAPRIGPVGDGIWRDENAIVVAAMVPASAEHLPLLTMTSRRGMTSEPIVDEVPPATQSHVGRLDWRMVVVDDEVLFIADNKVLAANVADQSVVERISKGTALLPGSTTGHVWALLDEAALVFDIDAQVREVRASYDLSGIGTPLASYSGGLVIDPFSDRLGPFALWSPARGVIRIWSLDDDAEFIDAAGNTIVVHTALGLATYNVVTGALTQSDTQLTIRQRTRGFVSPDGARLAYVDRQSAAGHPTVTVIDAESGAVLDGFNAASEDALHWVSDDEILFIERLGPSPNTTPVRLRNTSTSETSTVQDLPGAVSWVTVVFG